LFSINDSIHSIIDSFHNVYLAYQNYKYMKNSINDHYDY